MIYLTCQLKFEMQIEYIKLNTFTKTSNEVKQLKAFHKSANWWAGGQHGNRITQDQTIYSRRDEKINIAYEIILFNHAQLPFFIITVVYIDWMMQKICHKEGSLCW